MKAPSLPKSVENQVGQTKEKPKDEKGKIKIPRFTSRLEKCYV